MLGKKVQVEADKQKAQAEAAAAAVAAQEARFELARRLTEARRRRPPCRPCTACLPRRPCPVPPAPATVAQRASGGVAQSGRRGRAQVEGRKRHDFLSAVVSVMDGHLRYFKQGFEALSKLEPYMQQARRLHTAPPLACLQRRPSQGRLQGAVGCGGRG